MQLVINEYLASYFFSEEFQLFCQKLYYVANSALFLQFFWSKICGRAIFYAFSISVPRAGATPPLWHPRIQSNNSWWTTCRGVKIYIRLQFKICSFLAKHRKNWKCCPCFILFIQGSQWILRLLFSIFRYSISVWKGKVSRIRERWEKKWNMFHLGGLGGLGWGFKQKK